MGRLRKRLEYHYDDTGGWRPVGVGPDSAVPPTDNWVLDSKTWYIYDGKRVIQERDGSNTPLVSYTRGRDLSGSLEGAGGIGGLLSRSTGSSGNWTTHNTYFADGNGNITYMLDSSQAMVASYRYDPFGNTISKSGTLADANVYRFSSKEIHVNSGIYYYLYRFYDPNLQRWVNRDPLGERGGFNLYSFVKNEPTDAIDKWGEAWGYPLPPGVCGPPSPCAPNPDAEKSGWVICGYASDPKTKFPCPLYCPPPNSKAPPWRPPPLPKPIQPPLYTDCLTERTLNDCLNCCLQYPTYQQQTLCERRCQSKRWN